MMKSVFFLCFSLVIVSSPTARADEEAVRMIGGVALGLIGLALEEGQKQQEQQPSTQNDLQKVTTSSKPKLEYSQDVANAQLKLKQIGYYDGAVDGLKGQNTIDSMNRFEEIYSSQADDGAVDAMLSNGEIEILDKLVDNLDGELGNEQPVVAVNSDEGKPKKISEMKGVKAQENLTSKIEQLTAIKTLADACIAYKTSTGIYKDFEGKYKQYLDKDLQDNFQKVYDFDNTRLKQRAECLGVSDEQLQSVTIRSQQEYLDSQHSTMQKSGFYSVMKNPSVEERFVDDCNTFSYNLKRDYKERLKGSFNERTCE